VQTFPYERWHELQVAEFLDLVPELAIFFERPHLRVLHRLRGAVQESAKGVFLDCFFFTMGVRDERGGGLISICALIL
jgi:hypothetical protein